MSYLQLKQMRNRMQFVKMHGIGNDYVYINAFEYQIADPAALAVKISDRHTGVGGDGMILVAPPTDAAKAQGAQVRMRMFNSDGSESEMCGNGVRCVAKFAHDRGLAKGNPIQVETGRGVLTIQLGIMNGKVEAATVDMGEPILELAKIPVLEEYVGKTGQPNEYHIPFATDGKKTGILSHAIPATFVSMGNPHAIIYSPDVSKVDLEHIGPMLEHHKAFPRRMNIHFVQVHSPTEVTMRTWERGTGITLACGTGASAVCVAGVLTGNNSRKILAHLPGGDLHLEWRESDNHVFMTGPATEVFVGEWPE